MLLAVGIGPVKQFVKRKIAIIFLSIRFNMCSGCSKEPSHRDGSFEYPQHMFWLRNKKKYFSVTQSYLGAWTIDTCIITRVFNRQRWLRLSLAPSFSFKCLFMDSEMHVYSNKM